MKNQYIFPLMLIILNVGASLVELANGDIKKAVYFFAAAVLNVTVAF